MNQIKILRNVYNVKKGDYILFNGVVYQFCAGDGRILKAKGFDRYASLRISANEVKKIPFEQLQKVESNGLTKWIF